MPANADFKQSNFAFINDFYRAESLHIAEFMPEDLDGRDAWIYHNFVETDSE